jgi:hypothetical protein
MSLAQRHKYTGGPFSLSSCEEVGYLSAVWRRASELPVYGPYGVYTALDTQKFEELRNGIISTFRTVCIYDLKRVDLPAVIVRDEWEHQLRLLSDQFDLEDRNSVRKFLAEHQFLIKVLFDARQKVNQIFGVDTPMTLKLFTDPEDEPGETMLFVLVLTSLPVKEATARLMKIDEDWWVDQPNELTRLMNIDVEYR